MRKNCPSVRIESVVAECISLFTASSVMHTMTTEGGDGLAWSSQ